MLHNKVTVSLYCWCTVPVNASVPFKTHDSLNHNLLQDHHSFKLILAFIGYLNILNWSAKYFLEWLVKTGRRRKRCVQTHAVQKLSADSTAVNNRPPSTPTYTQTWETWRASVQTDDTYTHKQMSQSNIPPGDHYHEVNMCCKQSSAAQFNPLQGGMVGFLWMLINISCTFQDVVGYVVKF